MNKGPWAIFIEGKPAKHQNLNGYSQSVAVTGKAQFAMFSPVRMAEI